MKDCIFCKIVKGEIPSTKVYEDESILAILDIAPLNKGHVLVIPKNHVRWIHELGLDTKIWNVAHRIAKSIVSSLEYDHVNFLTLGYEVEHGHIHVVPRSPDDDLGRHVDWGKSKKYEADEMNKFADKIKSGI